MTNTHTALDLYAGLGGWSMAARHIGAHEYGVEIMPEALESRRLNGFETAYTDVWDIEKAAELQFDTLIASPPCQLWSMAGKGAAREHKGVMIQTVANEDHLDIAAARALGAHLGDENYAHVLVPLAYIDRYQPVYVALEQVPTVQPVWDAYKIALERRGYSVATGILNAEQHGVPQTRRRAILIASHTLARVALPTPTHSRYHSHTPAKLDAGVQKWVSMADALNFGMTERPAVTLGNAAGRGGGVGGSGAKAAIEREIEAGHYWPKSRPAPTVTGGGVGSGGPEPFGNSARKSLRALIEVELRQRRQRAEPGRADA